MKQFNLQVLMKYFGSEEEINLLNNLDKKEYEKLDGFVWAFRRELIDKITDL
jgi:hypothetical protein